MLTGTLLLPFVAAFVVFANGFDQTMRRKDESFCYGYEPIPNVPNTVHSTVH